MATGFDQRFAEFGVTQSQFRVLLTVHFVGGAEGITPTELADHLLIERPTVSGLEDRLVQRGLLRRVPTDDRRTHRIALTEAGGKILSGLSPAATALAEETLAILDEKEQETLRDLLQKLETQLREMARRRTERSEKEKDRSGE